MAYSQAISSDPKRRKQHSHSPEVSLAATRKKTAQLRLFRALSPSESPARIHLAGINGAQIRRATREEVLRRQLPFVAHKQTSS